MADYEDYEYDAFRPFGLLKLLRDKQPNFRDLPRTSSRAIYSLHRFIADLQKIGLVDINDEGDIKTTETFSQFLKALDISLTDLENYSPESSMVSSPIFGLPSTRFQKADIFMVMPFLEKLKPVYEDHIRNVAGKLGASIARGDDFFTSSSIVADVWNAITSCKIVIAECTGRNPNVFYEIGIAHTIGKPVILISQNKDDIPFDVRHIRSIFYEYTPRGMSEFEQILTKTLIHDGKLGKSITKK